MTVEQSSGGVQPDLLNCPISHEVFLLALKDPCGSVAFTEHDGSRVTHSNKSHLKVIPSWPGLFSLLMEGQD